MIYLIRDDRFYTKAGDETFFQELEQALKKALGEEFKFYRVTTEDLSNLSFDYPSLILDRCSEGFHKIEVCRSFGVGDGQVKAHQLVSRPGFKPIDHQLQQIPPGSYTLVDDDIASGSTLALLRTLLGEDKTINQTFTLTEHFWRSHSELKLLPFEFYDIVDLRDFIIGSKDGGLVVEEKFRVPYMLPFVNNIHRSKIPARNEWSFSMDLWKINLRYFERFPQLLLNQDPAFSALMEQSGFAPETDMREFCLTHLNFLKSIKPE